MKLSTLLVADVVQDTHSLICVHIYTHILSLFVTHLLLSLSLSLSPSLSLSFSLSGGGWVLSTAVHVYTHTLYLFVTHLLPSLSPPSFSFPSVFFLSLSGGGWVLSTAVQRFKGIAIYSPIINGKCGFFLEQAIFDVSLFSSQVWGAIWLQCRQAEYQRRYIRWENLVNFLPIPPRDTGGH